MVLLCLRFFNSLMELEEKARKQESKKERKKNIKRSEPFLCQNNEVKGQSKPRYFCFLKGLLCPLFKKLDFIYLFLERGEKREKERENDIHWLPLSCPQLGTWPTTQSCALTGNQTSTLLVCRLVLNPLSHTSQGPRFYKEGLVRVVVLEPCELSLMRK